MPIENHPKATDVRSAVLKTFADTERDGSLTRLQRLSKLFDTQPLAVVRAALSLKLAKQVSGILPHTTDYKRLSEAATMFDAYGSGQWEIIAADTLDHKIGDVAYKGSSWNERYRLAVALKRERRARAAHDERFAELISVAAKINPKANKESLAAAAERIISAEQAEREADKESPGTKAKRFVTSAYNDADRGPDWIKAFLLAAHMHLDEMLRTAPGPVRTIKTAEVVRPDGEESFANLPVDLPGERKRRAAARHATEPVEPAQATGTGD